MVIFFYSSDRKQTRTSSFPWAGSRLREVPTADTGYSKGKKKGGSEGGADGSRVEPAPREQGRSLIKLVMWSQQDL